VASVIPDEVTAADELSLTSVTRDDVDDTVAGNDADDDDKG